MNKLIENRIHSEWKKPLTCIFIIENKQPIRMQLRILFFNVFSNVSLKMLNENSIRRRPSKKASWRIIVCLPLPNDPINSPNFEMKQNNWIIYFVLLKISLFHSNIIENNCTFFLKYKYELTRTDREIQNFFQSLHKSTQQHWLCTR